MRRARELHGREVGGQDDVPSGEGPGDEVDPQPFHSDAVQQGIPLAVEYPGNGRRPEKNDAVDADRRRNRCNQGVTKDGLHGGSVSHAVIPADKRLNALGNPGEDGEDHQRQVRDDSVGGDARVALEAQDDPVEDDHHDAR